MIIHYKRYEGPLRPLRIETCEEDDDNEGDEDEDKNGIEDEDNVDECGCIYWNEDCEEYCDDAEEEETQCRICKMNDSYFKYYAALQDLGATECPCHANCSCEDRRERTRQKTI